MIELKARTKISKNVYYYELIQSATAKKKGIVNVVTDVQILANCIAIAKNIYEPVRAHFGLAIAISSFYRNPVLNTAVGGSRYSQHRKGEAIDLNGNKWGGVSNKAIFEFIRDNLEYDQLINEYNYSWVHVSYKLSGKNRKQIKIIT
ncbi:MAG: peptidase M15 [Alkaliphilus sp.]|nr:MAG: peptidase M15 [Alkaliphilus sp.]